MLDDVRHASTPQRTPDSLLRASAGKEIEVINAGVSGDGTANEYFFLRDPMLPYDSDLVLLGFYVGNDVYDNVDFDEFTDFLDERGYLRPRARPAAT